VSEVRSRCVTIDDGAFPEPMHTILQYQTQQPDIAHRPYLIHRSRLPSIVQPASSTHYHHPRPRLPTTGAYCIPISSVNCICFWISACVTVGRLIAILASKSRKFRSGSSSSSDETSVHAFSCAAGSPGEHGVSFCCGPSGVSTVTCCQHTRCLGAEDVRA
jgi:hypothetical protein